MINPKNWNGLNFCSVVRGCDRYVFLFDDANYFSLQCQVEQFALNPDLNFTQADAIAVLKNARQVMAMKD